jgi:hypothetical protein
MREFWREIWDGLPIVRAAHVLVRRRDRGAMVLSALLAIYALLSLATPWWSELQLTLIEAHHMRPRSMWRWIALQPAPKMYSFAHRAWLGTVPLHGRTADRFAREHFWVNHYPARRARFDGSRGRELEGRPGARYLYIETSYRGLTVKTGYEVRLVGATVRLRRIAEAR